MVSAATFGVDLSSNESGDAYQVYGSPQSAVLKASDTRS